MKKNKSILPLIPKPKQPEPDGIEVERVAAGDFAKGVIMPIERDVIPGLFSGEERAAPPDGGMLNRDASLFNFDEKEEETEKNGLRYVDINMLEPFKNHPFRLYEGERLADMIESIKNNGIICPIIVRPIREEASVARSSFEILSGHNRVEAAKRLGMRRLPAVIKRGLDDDEAMAYVVETNLIQRSFADMAHSEKAAVLKSRHDRIFSQGKRNDIITELEKMILPAAETAARPQAETAAPAQRPRSRDIVGREYSLSKNTVARYLRVAELAPEFFPQLDSGALPFLAAVELSYLKADEQRAVFAAYGARGRAVPVRAAAELRRLAGEGTLTEERIGALTAPSAAAQGADGAVTLSRRTVEEYFGAEAESAAVRREITAALRLLKKKIPAALAGKMTAEELAGLNVEKYILRLIEAQKRK